MANISIKKDLAKLLQVFLNLSLDWKKHLLYISDILLE